jgi:hypothetical protein
MKRFMILNLVLGLITLTGCSELQVIKSATLRELRAEAVSLEMVAQQKESAPDQSITVPELRPVKKTYVAQAAYNPFLAGAVKRDATPHKGMWERGN